MPTISVLIPLVDPDHLDLCLASVMAQTFTDFEVVVGDFTDGRETRSIASKWSDPRVRYVPATPTDGTGSRWEHLLGLAKGGYVKFLDPADFLYPRSLEMLHAALQASGAALAFHDQDVVDGSGRVIGQACATNEGELLLYTPDFVMKHMIGRRVNFICGPSNTLVAADFLRCRPAPFSIGGGDRNLALAEMALYTNIAAAGHNVVGCGFRCSAARHGRDGTAASRTSEQMFEWEYLCRWAADSGYLPADETEVALKEIQDGYTAQLSAFPELAGFLEVGPSADDGTFLTTDFDAALAAAWAAAEGRRVCLAPAATQPGPVVKLHVGCGTNYVSGWVNIDNNSDNNIGRLDLNWDMRRPLPYDDGSVDFIYNEHFLEHLSAAEGKRALKDFMRVLRPGGVLRVAMPDLEDVIRKYLELPIEDDPTIERFDLGFVRTRAERLNMAFRWWGHQWLYDWEELERRLRDAGGENITRASIYRSEHPELADLETRDESRLIAEVTKI